jgi:hypothetical protein
MAHLHKRVILDLDCIAGEVALSHFVSHFVQEAYGYPVDHNAPIFPDYGESLEIKIQRYFFRSTCL